MERSNRQIIQRYLRHNKKFPHIWCPGCGNGVVLGCLLRAIDRIGWIKDDVVLVSGIGCSSRAPVYVDFNTLHTVHGRALAFATGVKLARPHLHVVTLMGDGDSVGIGGNHFVHACRRNIDMTAVIINNQIYGMTGGQVSPATPQGALSTTTVYGNLDQPFDISRLAEAAGATFVARSTTYHVKELEKVLGQAFRHVGFSVVEVVAGCPTTYGRRNKLGGPVEMMRWQKEKAVSVKKAREMAPEELAGRIVTGVLVDRDAPEYTREYEKIREAARAAQPEPTVEEDKVDRTGAEP
ncbi:2-oxoacid:ferredoxin oxidoreductase subunit beta [Deferrisoma camini]|uniref:2-oxoacid:ferredoxin oxidoreductase subunit beta n=1 Tax=Deferrisoma camini TaxID=1035120 RepID=UPI00046D36EC|nr:2-oxoacid:ferredoxin oxidoreductase subunit beta [Deferrisoma camini]